MKYFWKKLDTVPLQNKGGFLKLNQILVRNILHSFMFCEVCMRVVNLNGFPLDENVVAFFLFLN